METMVGWVVLVLPGGSTEPWKRRASIGVFVSEAAVGREAILPGILHPPIPLPA